MISVKCLKYDFRMYYIHMIVIFGQGPRNYIFFNKNLPTAFRGGLA